MFGTILVGVVVAALVLWMALSKDKLAIAIRVKFTGVKNQMAEALNDAKARIDAAIAEIEQNTVKAKQGLVIVKTQRKALEAQLAVATTDVAQWEQKSDLAASQNRPDLVRECLIRRDTAQERVTELSPQLDATKGSEAKIEGKVTVLEDQRAKLQAKRAEIERRAETATVVLSVSQLLAGINMDSGKRHLDEAEAIVSGIEAKAAAMEEVAEAAQKDVKLEDELAALSRPDLDAEVAAKMAKHQAT